MRGNGNFMLVVSLTLVSCLPSAWFFYSKSNKNVSTRRWHEMIQLLGIKQNRQKLERVRKLCCNLNFFFLLLAITFKLHFFCSPFWLLSPSLLPFPFAFIIGISVQFCFQPYLWYLKVIFCSYVSLQFSSCLLSLSISLQLSLYFS